MNKKKSNSVELGKVLNTHGLKGLLVIKLINKSSTQIKTNQEIYIDDQPHIVELINLANNKKTLLKIKEVDSIESAQLLKGKSISIDRDQLETCDDDEYYLHEIIGFELESESGKSLGKIEGTYDNGAHDILSLSGTKEKFDYILLPGSILKIDESKKIVIVKDFELI